jgi:pimeloyl-ACP methyl ester carboxylesterase
MSGWSNSERRWDTHAGLVDGPLETRVVAVLAKWAPWTLRGVLTVTVRGIQWFAETGVGQRWIDQLLEKVRKFAWEPKRRDGMDTEIYAEEDEDGDSEEYRERMLNFAFEAFRQGLEATVEEARLLGQDWGLNFDEIDFDPVKMWHETKDRNAPIATIRWMAKLLLYSKMVEYSNATHYTVGVHIETALLDLVPEDMVKAYGNEG